MKLLLTGPQGPGKTTAGELAARRSERGVHIDVVLSDVVAGPLLAELAPQYDRVVVLFPRENAIRVRHAPWVYRLFAGGTERVGDWIDNSDLTPDETAAAILRA